MEILGTVSPSPNLRLGNSELEVIKFATLVLSFDFTSLESFYCVKHVSMFLIPSKASLSSYDSKDMQYSQLFQAFSSCILACGDSVSVS